MLCSKLWVKLLVVEEGVVTIENVVTVVAAGLAFVASLIAAAVALYTARFRRFALEKWWERKAGAYAEVVSSLVALTYSLDRWVRKELLERTDEEYRPPPELQKRIRDEYEEARIRIERTAVEGDYFLSRKSANALSILIKQLRQEPEWPVTGDSWVASLSTYHKAAQDCLNTVREEARGDLKVK